ncbi:MAG TPA: tetratricopeptide repeat protein [Terracidiphilus sp.]|jgi:Flp pilus assembly protein TadD
MMKNHKRARYGAATIAAFCAAVALCQTPSDPVAAARQMVDSGKVAESESTLRNFLVAHPSDADAHFLLGYVLFREQKGRESLAEFTAGAKYRRPNAEELKIVASDYVLLGDFGDADKWFSEVVAETPNDPNANYLLGRTKFNENDFSAAISSFERALTLHPKYVEAENNIGLAWRELNNLDKARAAFQTAIDWQGDTPGDAQPFLNLGTLLADQNNLDAAISSLQKAAALSPDNPTVHEELSHVYAAKQNLPKAQSELERAIALAPGISSLHFKLGQIYRKEGLKDRAQQEFAICAKLSGAHSSDKTPNPISINQFSKETGP